MDADGRRPGNAINHWVRNGVPFRHWPVIRAVAAREAGEHPWRHGCGAGLDPAACEVSL